MRTSPPISLLLAMRPQHWVKNLFVFAAPMFGRKLFTVNGLALASATFAAFCLCSSAVYLFNDLCDINEDRAHPVKCKRPLASGQLAPCTAWIAMIVLALAALGVSYFLTHLAVALIVLAYMASNVLYSRYLKHVVILDIMFIAVGFILRMLAGAFAGHVLPSYWLVLCTLNVSVFLGFVKRRSEISVMGTQASRHRPVLQHYSPVFLDQMIAIVTGATLICYTLYTVDLRTSQIFGSHLLVLTVPFVMYGIFRYLYMAYQCNQGGSPTRAILADRPFLLNGVLWAVSSGLIIYWGPPLHAWLRGIAG